MQELSKGTNHQLLISVHDKQSDGFEIKSSNATVNLQKSYPTLLVT